MSSTAEVKVACFRCRFYRGALSISGRILEVFLVFLPKCKGDLNVLYLKGTVKTSALLLLLLLKMFGTTGIEEKTVIYAKQGEKALGPGRSLLRKSTSDHSPAKMIRLTLTVVLVYSLCWLPFNMLIVITDFHEELIFWPHIHHVWFVFHWLAMSHACYNPLILCWMNAKFREGYLTFLYNVLPCCKPKISKYLLGMKDSSMLQRSHTYSSRFSSTRMSRNTRHPDESRARRESVGSETASVQHPSTAEYPLRMIPGCSCEHPSSVVGSVPKEKQIYECLEMSNLQ